MSQASQASSGRPVVMITGAASGIGAACAREFASAGYDLVMTDLNEDGLASVVQAAQQAGATVATLAGNIADRALAPACVELARERFGRLDAAVNSAGITGPIGVLAEYDEDEWDRTVAINLSSVWRCMRFQIPLMLTRGQGAIVNISSLAGLKGFPNNSAYAATKHGVVGLTRSASYDYAASGIRINAICPGYIRTPMTEYFWKMKPEVGSVVAQAQPIGRVGEPQEIADTALWLCSDKASFVVGQAIAVDGGQGV